MKRRTDPGHRKHPQHVRQRISGATRARWPGPQHNNTGWHVRRLVQQLSRPNVFLKDQCERGTVPTLTFLALLELGYGKAQPGQEVPKRPPLVAMTPEEFFGEKGKALANWQEPLTPMQKAARACTLDNPLVRRRLRHEWAEGTMAPAIPRWLTAHARELTDVARRRRGPRAYVTPSGQLPWANDPLAAQVRAMLAAQEADEQRRELPQQAAETTEARPSETKDDIDVDPADVLEAVRPEDLGPEPRLSP
jgi:hypothetical protein